MKSLNNQSPATKNQITNIKPEVKKHVNILDGYIGNSINGGMVKPIAYRRIMAGTYDYEYRLRLNIKMLTPKTPAYQALKATFTAFWVPDTAVWTNALKWASQKGGSTLTKVKEIPNLGGQTLPLYDDIHKYDTTPESNDAVPVTDTDIWRDSWQSAYIPRYQTGGIKNTIYTTFPKLSVLPLRGFKKIYNEYLRNKEYDTEWTEYTGDTVTSAEFATLLPSASENRLDYFIVRGKRQNSYYTDYRTELLGDDEALPGTGTGDLIVHTEWQKKVAEFRSEAENAQLNDRDILAKLYGTKKLKDGYVEMLGKRTVPLNYGVVNQSTYNINSDVSKEYQALGTQGAYSYTEIDIPLYQFQEFKENGYLHVIMQVSADSVFETGFERTSMNVNVMDNYRPDLKDLKHDVIYRYEKCGTQRTASNLSDIDGFKRKFSELFKLPNVIAGDMGTNSHYKTGHLPGWQASTMCVDMASTTPGQYTFQFFEMNDELTEQGNKKRIWKDYTDAILNMNLAIRETEEAFDRGPEYGYLMRILGQNQIFFVGMQSVKTDLPVDENIKTNFTEWGEE